MNWINYVVRLLAGLCPKCGGTLRKFNNKIQFLPDSVAELDFSYDEDCVHVSILKCETPGCTYWSRV